MDFSFFRKARFFSSSSSSLVNVEWCEDWLRERFLFFFVVFLWVLFWHIRISCIYWWRSLEDIFLLHKCAQPVDTNDLSDRRRTSSLSFSLSVFVLFSSSFLSLSVKPLVIIRLADRYTCQCVCVATFICACLCMIASRINREVSDKEIEFHVCVDV